jgi:hypothetical protein
MSMQSLDIKYSELFVLAILYGLEGVMDVQEKTLPNGQRFEIGTYHLDYPNDGSLPLDRPRYLVEITSEETHTSATPPSLLKEEQETMTSVIDAFMKVLLQQLERFPVRQQKLSTYSYVLMDDDQTFYIRILKPLSK